VLIAWAGAIAFIGSLGYLVYFYLGPLGSTAGDPEQRTPHVLVNSALFSLFALHHSLLARSGAKRRLTRVVPPEFERTTYVAMASVLAVLMGLLWQPVAGLIYRVEAGPRLALWSAQLLGLLLAVRAARVIDVWELAGVRQIASGGLRPRLTIDGPFRVVRHPLYLGWILMVFATPTLTANRLLFAVLSTLYLILAIPWEERSLVAVHGDRYRDYQRAVRWRLVPGIW
jgi:protein-S-isoprenylcysteine O-methyltransferase Ste14